MSMDNIRDLFLEDETFEDTTRGRARKIMAEYQKFIDTN